MKTRTMILTFLTGAAAIAGCDDSGPLDPVAGDAVRVPALQSRQSDATPQALRVLSRNVFLGGDIEPVLIAAATAPQTLPAVVATTWESIQETDFPTRARVIARETAASQPDVVGLQEVALFRTQFPGDAGASPAGDVTYDYLKILMAELEAQGVWYSVAAAGSSIDVELPALDPSSPSGLMDVRYTDRDVVLVREGVEVVDAESGTYAAVLPGPLGLNLPRAYNRVNLIHRGRPYHFVNTHLETDEASIQIQTAQAAELVQMLDLVHVPTIVVGDLNGQPTEENDGTRVYALLDVAGFKDAWLSVRSSDNPSGFTCCFEKNLMGGSLFERIDYVFARGGGGEDPLQVWEVFTVGDERRYGQVPENLNASDHAGVFVALAPSPVVEE